MLWVNEQKKGFMCRPALPNLFVQQLRVVLRK